MSLALIQVQLTIRSGAMGMKPSNNYQSDRPESGGADKDGIRENNGLLDREQEKFAQEKAAEKKAMGTGKSGMGTGEPGMGTGESGMGADSDLDPSND